MAESIFRRTDLFYRGPAPTLIISTPTACHQQLLPLPGKAQYVELTSALRILLAGAAARLIVVHVLGVRQAIGDATGFARPHIAVAATTLASLAVVPTVAGNVALSAAWVFVGVHIVAAATLLSTQPARVRAIAPQQVPKGKLDA